MAKEKTTDETAEPTMTQVLTRLADIAAANQHVQQAQLKQTAPKSNASGPKISAFNPRGEKDYPMPELKCEVYAPWKMTPQVHSLTREEVELFNRLEPGDRTLELNDGSTIQVAVVGVRHAATGKLEKLSLMGARDSDTGQHQALFTHENKQQFPSLTAILRQLLDQQGTDHRDVLTMKREAALVASGDLAVSQGA